MKQKRKRRLARAALGGGAAILLAVSIAGIWLVVAANSRIYAEARAMGMPVEPEDLYNTPAPQPEDNAAPLILEAVRLQKSAGFGRPWEMLADMEWGTDAEAEAVAKTIAAHPKYFAVLEQAAAKPACRFDHDWSLAYDVTFHEFRGRQGVEMMQVRALVNARRRNDAQAVADTETALRLIEHLIQEPTMYHLVAMIREKRDAYTYAILAASYMRDANELKRLRDTIESDPMPDLFHHLRGEVTLTAATLRNWSIKDLHESRYSFFVGPPLTRRSGPPPDPAVRVVANKILECWRPLYELKPEERSLEAIHKVLLEIDARLAAMKGIHAEYVNQFFFEMGSLYPLIQDMQAEQTATLAAIDLFLYRQQNGSYPETLDALNGNYPDPFSGNQMGYRRHGDGFRIWSVGRDLKDNGGRLKSETNNEEFDLVTQHPRPDPRTQ